MNDAMKKTTSISETLKREQDREMQRLLARVQMAV